MKVVISGNGLGSRVLSLFLAQRPDLVQSITVIEKSIEKKNELLISNVIDPVFIGLWGPSIHVLRHLDVWKDLSHSKSVVETSYRTVSGVRIAKPRTNLLLPDVGVKRSLTFINRSELLNALDKKCVSLINFACFMDLQLFYATT